MHHRGDESHERNQAETKGVIAEIVAENGKPVQFGQVLFRVK